jgi:general secretion pathway protein D
MNKKTTAEYIKTKKIFFFLLIFTLSISQIFYHTDAGAQAKKKTAVKKAAAPQLFSLNFKDVEIAEFVNIMSQLTQKNIIIDDTVKGKITINSARKVPIKDAYEIMKSILEIKGFAVIETENLVKVVPIKDAVKKNIEVIVDGEPRTLDTDDTITYLIELKYADANEVMAALNTLKSKNTDIVLYRTLNTLIISGTAIDIDGLVRVTRLLDKQIEEGVETQGKPKGNIHVVHLENSNAEQLAGVLSRIPFSETALIDSSPQPGPQPAPSKSAARTTGAQTPAAQQNKTKLSIIANKETNSLIITATPEELVEISRIIKELDIVREQVLIEALIIEVNAENGWGFGIDWMLGQKYGTNIFGGSSIMGTAPNYSTPSGLGGRTLPVPAATGFQVGYLADTQILGYALLNASGTEKNFNILSTPQILTIDNQEAELNVGEEIPVPSNNRISDTGTQFYTFEYKSVGVKLKITPHITKQQRITLDLYQEVNSVLGQTQILDQGGIIPPTLGKRDIKTKVTVMDGKTIVVGGLIRNNKTVQETKVPILGDIPVIGWAFKRKSVEYKKTNLLVFITPHIVTKQEKIDSVTRQKRNTLKRLKDEE